MNLELQNRTVIVTGANGGIGRAAVAAFLTEGANVYGLDISAPSDDVPADPKLVTQVVDISDGKAVADVVAEILKEQGKIDIVINNAGVRPLAWLEDTSDEIWEQAINVNLRGTFYICRAVVPSMKERRYGKIVNIASLSGRRGNPRQGSAYGAAKGGVISFTKSVAHEVGPYNINVNALAPGPIRTPMYLQRSEAEIAETTNMIPLGRLGRPEDLVGPILLLSSDYGSYIHGQVLNIDGGQLMA